MSTFIGGGYVKLRRAIFEHTAMGLVSGMETLTFIALISFADAATGVWAGCAGTLAKWAGMSEDTTTKCLRSLEDKGYILRDFKQGGNSYYKILIDKYTVTVGEYKHWRVALPETKRMLGVPEEPLNQKRRKEFIENIKNAVAYPAYERDPDAEDESVYEGAGALVGALVGDSTGGSTGE